MALWLPGYAKLSHDGHVQRCAKRLRDFKCDGDAASGQAQDDDVGPVRIVRQMPGEDAAGMNAIFELHCIHLGVRCGCSGRGQPMSSHLNNTLVMEGRPTFG